MATLPWLILSPFSVISYISVISGKVFLIRLFAFFAAEDSLVNRLAAFEALFQAVPVLDLLFAVAPAKQDHLILESAGEIEQADLQIFYLHADGVDFGDGILGVL